MKRRTAWNFLPPDSAAWMLDRIICPFPEWYGNKFVSDVGESNISFCDDFDEFDPVWRFSPNCGEPGLEAESATEDMLSSESLTIVSTWRSYSGPSKWSGKMSSAHSIMVWMSWNMALAWNSRAYLYYVVNVRLTHDWIGMVRNVDYGGAKTHRQVIRVHHIFVRVHWQTT